MTTWHTVCEDVVLFWGVQLSLSLEESHVTAESVTTQLPAMVICQAFGELYINSVAYMSQPPFPAFIFLYSTYPFFF